MPMERDLQRDERIDALVLEVQSGNEDAFRELFDLLFPRVYRYVSYKIDRQDVDDLVSDIFLRLWAKIGEYHKGTSRFEAWVFTIAYRMIIDYYRKQKDLISLDEVEYELSGDESQEISVGTKLSEEHLRAVVEQLPHKYAQPIMLRFFAELEYVEIADVLGLTEGNVRILLFRGLRKLRDILPYDRE